MLVLIAWNLQEPGSHSPNEGLLNYSKNILRPTAESLLEIHVFAWKRTRSLKRLLASLEVANTATSLQGPRIPLYFHIDFDQKEEVVEICTSFNWTLGPKHIIQRPHKYGMPQNILNSWHPTRTNQYALFLEDDIELSPLFPNWLIYCLNYLELNREQGLIGCSFYTPIVDEIGPAPNAWSPPKWNPHKLLSGEPLFYFQLPCSWGAIYTSQYWMPFTTYYQLRANLPKAPDVPSSRTVEWFKSWKRHLAELMYVHGWYMLYPNFENQTSFSTNYFEKGIHSGPDGIELAYPDNLKRFDHRFTVPLVTDDFQLGKLQNTVSNTRNIPFVSIYHHRVSHRNTLYGQIAWTEKELMHISHYISDHIR